jgi:hypothetical protein
MIVAREHILEGIELSWKRKLFGLQAFRAFTAANLAHFWSAWTRGGGLSNFVLFESFFLFQLLTIDLYIAH